MIHGIVSINSHTREYMILTMTVVGLLTSCYLAMSHIPVLSLYINISLYILNTFFVSVYLWVLMGTKKKFLCVCMFNWPCLMRVMCILYFFNNLNIMMAHLNNENLRFIWQIFWSGNEDIIFKTALIITLQLVLLTFR